MFQSAQELLEYLLSGKRLTSAQLDQALADIPVEDLHWDYKHGNITNSENKAIAEVRRYVCAFANSDGGVLIIGVDNNKVVTGTKSPSGTLTIDQWASRAVNDLQFTLTPKPRFIPMQYDSQKQILLIAVPRSIGFTALREGGKDVYYLRFHDETSNTKNRRAPEYLVTDILLGRRERPNFTVTGVRSLAWQNIGPDNDGTAKFHGNLRFAVENQGLTWAEDVRIGWVCPILQPKHAGLSHFLLSSIEAIPSVEAFETGHFSFAHVQHGIDSMAPFEAKAIGDFVIHGLHSRHGHHFDYSFLAGFYLVSKNTPPVWFEFKLQVDVKFKTALKNVTRKASMYEDALQGLVQIEQVSGRRPRVGLNNFQWAGIDRDKWFWPPVDPVTPS